MRILLVEAPWAWAGGAGAGGGGVPLGPALLAGVLRAEGHEVALHVPGIDPWGGTAPAEALAAALATVGPDVVGIGCTSGSFAGARAAVALVRRTCPTARIVLGGVHPTLVPEAAAAVPGVDAVLRGEAEETLPLLVAALREGRGFADIPGAVWRDAEGLHHGPPPRLVEDLDRFPLPAHDALLWAERAHPAAFAGVLTARGCPFACRYCAAPRLTERRLRRRAPERVAEEVTRLVHERRVEYLFYHDSVFTLDRGHLARVLDAVVRAVGPVPFACQTRTEAVDAERAALLARAGGHRVALGIESGVPETLARIGKPTDLEGVRRAVGTLADAGLAVTGFFMIGFPWEREADFEQTIEVALGLGLDAVHLFAAVPLPGSQLAEDEAAFVLPDGFDFRSPEVDATALPKGVFAAAFARASARVEAYNRARIVPPDSPTARGPSAARRAQMPGSKPHHPEA